MSEPFLDKAYAKTDAQDTRALYDAWSASYEAEVSQNGYVTPARCAAALAAFAPDLSVPLLDFGCGTGLAGLAFRLAGFSVIDGVDLSAKMLAQAKDKGVYRSLTQIEADVRPSGGHTLISAVGVIGAGAAPLSVFDTLMHGLPQGGMMVFSFNDHTLADPANTGRLNEWLDCGAARLLFCENGPHLTARNMNSTVYVVQKA
jgi:predicted TPR repeat methyltransferase